jgi:amino acid transporter
MAEVAIQGIEIKKETGKLKRELTLFPLFALIYFTVCGGSFGYEGLIGGTGPLMAIGLLIITPLLFSIPNMLMVREMQSMMPHEGGYYHWVKQAFGPFTGFLAGWMNWVVSWVDVSIYPVLAAYYLSFFIAPLRDGATIFGLQVDAWVLQWVVALVLIWLVSALNIRGARFTGLFSGWLGIVMIVPLVIMSVVGIYNWIHSGTTVALPILSTGAVTNAGALFTAFSSGLYIAMWNFMGWELPTAAGSEIVKPKRTYPIAMVLVLVAAIATYGIPTIAGLYGGAGAGGRYMLWGQEPADGQTLGQYMQENYNVDTATLQSWGANPDSNVGWFFPDIARAVGEQATGPGTFLPNFLGISVMIAAILSMVGLFIGNGLGGTRVPFAMAEDGMMPKFMVKVHPKYGTPWISIIFCGVLFSIFSLQTFSMLVVVDVFLNMVVLMAEILALWVMRRKRPDLPRQKVPGGVAGLLYITLAPALIIGLAIWSSITVDYGMISIWLSLAAIGLGAILYFPVRALAKKNVPDVDPFQASAEGD